MNDYKYYLDNGIYNFQDGKYEDAIENINKSLELKNDWAIPYFYRGAVYDVMKKYDEAMLDYTKALSLDDKMTDAYYNRAKIILSRKDIENPNIEGAIKDLEKALELDEKFVDALLAKFHLENTGILRTFKGQELEGITYNHVVLQIFLCIFAP